MYCICLTLLSNVFFPFTKAAGMRCWIFSQNGMTHETIIVKAWSKVILFCLKGCFSFLRRCLRLTGNTCNVERYAYPDRFEYVASLWQGVMTSTFLLIMHHTFFIRSFFGPGLVGGFLKCQDTFCHQKFPEWMNFFLLKRTSKSLIRSQNNL